MIGGDPGLLAQQAVSLAEASTSTITSLWAPFKAVASALARRHSSLRCTMRAGAPARFQPGHRFRHGADL